MARDMLSSMKRVGPHIWPVLIVFAIASCATVPLSQDTASVERLVRELNEAPVERLVELTATPFLLDDELVVLEADVTIMWQNLRDAGFAFDGAQVVSVTPGGAPPVAFGSSLDVEAWFDRYAASDWASTEVQTTHGTFLILTGSAADDVPLIYGFTGPIR